MPPSIAWPCGGAAGIRRIPVRPNLVAKSCVIGAPQSAPSPLTQPGLLQRINRPLHGRHRRRQQRRHPNRLRLVRLHRLHKLLRRHVDPRSTTSNPAPFNIMPTRFLPMSCRSPDTVPTSTCPPISRSPRPGTAATGSSRLHRPRRDEHLRHKSLAASNRRPTSPMAGMHALCRMSSAGTFAPVPPPPPPRSAWHPRSVWRHRWFRDS